MKMIRASLVLAAGVLACLQASAAQKAYPRGIEGVIGAGMVEVAAAVEAPQVKDDLFAGTEKFAQGASDVTEVNLDPKMLSMLGKTTSGDLARKMEFIVVHSYSYEKAGMYRPEDVEAYRRKLADGSWSCFIHTRDKEGSTDICQRTAADNETHEMVIMTAEAKELTFIHLRGRMTFDDLRKMGGSMGMGMSNGAKDKDKEKDKEKDK